MGEVMGIKNCTCGNEHWAMYGNVQSPCYKPETHGTPYVNSTGNIYFLKF